MNIIRAFRSSMNLNSFQLPELYCKTTSVAVASFITFGMQWNCSYGKTLGFACLFSSLTYLSEKNKHENRIKPWFSKPIKVYNRLYVTLYYIPLLFTQFLTNNTPQATPLKEWWRRCLKMHLKIEIGKS